MKKVLTVFVLYILILSAVGCEKANVTEQKTVNLDSANASSDMISVPLICQYPSLPTGCEAAAATMVLNFYEENITAEIFAENWMPCCENFYYKNNQLYGPNPNNEFVGNPFSTNSYGCYAKPIVNAINNNSNQCSAVLLKDRTISSLCKEYIDEGKPILIWATMGMKPSSEGNSWFLSDDSCFTWISGEHCVVLVGYNDEYYFVNDSISGSVVAFKKDVVEKRFEELGSQAVYIYKNDDNF